MTCASAGFDGPKPVARKSRRAPVTSAPTTEGIISVHDLTAQANPQQHGPETGLMSGRLPTENVREIGGDRAVALICYDGERVELSREDALLYRAGSGAC